MKRPKLVRDDSGERAGWWLGDRFVPDKPPEVDAWYRARELERENAALRELATTIRERYTRPWRQGAHHNLGCDACGYSWDAPADERHSDGCIVSMANAALAKNPNHSGHLPTEASDFHPEASGPVWLGPNDEHLTSGTPVNAAAESAVGALHSSDVESAGAIKRVAEVARTMRARGDALVEGAGDDEEDAWMATLGEHYQLLAGEIDEALAGSPSEVARPDALKEMEARKDGAYEERNRVVAALARMAQRAGFRVGVAKTAIEGWSEDWHSCCYIDLPTGQLSWHFHDSHAPLFEGLPNYIEGWDGHDTPEKYRRLDAYARAVGPDEVIAAYQLGLARGERGREACHEEHVNTLDDLTRVRDECNRRRTSLERLRDYVADNMGDFAGKEELLAEFSTALFGKGDAPGVGQQELERRTLANLLGRARSYVADSHTNGAADLLARIDGALSAVRESGTPSPEAHPK